MTRKSRKRGLGNRGKTFNVFAEEHRPQPTWRSLKLGRNPVTLLDLVISVPLISAALTRIDSFGSRGRAYPLSVVVRWLFMMPLCHYRCLEHMADRLITDEAVKWAILGDPGALGEDRRGGIAPSRPYISGEISDHLDTLIAELQHLYDSMIAALLRWNPRLKYALIYDRSMIPTWGNPERAEYEYIAETGRWKKTGSKLPATDPDAATWVKGDGGGFGYGLSALIFCRHPIPLGVSLKAPRGNDERLIATRMLIEAHSKFGPLLEIEDEELAVFIADAGLPGKEFYASLRSFGYEPVTPYNWKTKEEEILDDVKLITRKGRNYLELDVRRDGTPLCPRGDWDTKTFTGGRRPLVPLPSDITARAQRWCCPLNAVGECPNPCSLEPYYKDELNLNVLYPRVKKLVRNLDKEEGFRYVLFPRIGEEGRTLISYRSRVEHEFSYFKGRGCFGGDGEARLPIREEKRLKLRLLCTLIPLVALAMLNLGVPMPADLLDDWFSEIESSPADEEAA